MVRNSSCNANRFASAFLAALLGGRRSVSRRINLAMREFTSALVLDCREGVSDAPPRFNSNLESRDSICSNDVWGGVKLLILGHALKSDLLNLFHGVVNVNTTSARVE